MLDFLVDSAVYAASTAYQMLAGKQYNWAVRGLTLAYEAMNALKLSAFVAWCHKSEGAHVVSPMVWERLADAQQAYKSESGDTTFMQEFDDILIQHLVPQLEAQSLTFKFWDQLLQILLLNIHAE